MWQVAELSDFSLVPLCCEKNPDLEPMTILRHLFSVVFLFESRRDNPDFCYVNHDHLVLWKLDDF